MSARRRDIRQPTVGQSSGAAVSGAPRGLRGRLGHLGNQQLLRLTGIYATREKIQAHPNLQRSEDAAPEVSVQTIRDASPTKTSTQGPVFVEFDRLGRWDAADVLENLGAIPNDMKDAIVAGSVSAARFCAALRNRVVTAAAIADAATKAAYESIARALYSRVTELAFATSRSPLTYNQLREVAVWAKKFPSVPATSSGTSATNVSQGASSVPQFDELDNVAVTGLNELFKLTKARGTEFCAHIVRKSDGSFRIGAIQTSKKDDFCKAVTQKTDEETFVAFLHSHPAGRGHNFTQGAMLERTVEGDIERSESTRLVFYLVNELGERKRYTPSGEPGGIGIRKDLGKVPEEPESK